MQATEALCHLSVTDIKKTFCNVSFFSKNEACVNCGTYIKCHSPNLVIGRETTEQLAGAFIYYVDQILPSGLSTVTFPPLLVHIVIECPLSKKHKEDVKIM